MEFWIQKHDFSSDKSLKGSPAVISKAFAEFDWSYELSKYDENVSERSCPPGFGIMFDGQIVHICPFDEFNCYINYHYPHKMRLFGIFPITRQKTVYIEKFALSEVTGLIKQVLSGNKTNILQQKI